MYAVICNFGYKNYNQLLRSVFICNFRKLTIRKVNVKIQLISAVCILNSSHDSFNYSCANKINKCSDILHHRGNMSVTLFSRRVHRIYLSVLWQILYPRSRGVKLYKPHLYHASLAVNSTLSQSGTSVQGWTNGRRNSNIAETGGEAVRGFDCHTNDYHFDARPDIRFIVIPLIDIRQMLESLPTPGHDRFFPVSFRHQKLGNPKGKLFPLWMYSKFIWLP